LVHMFALFILLGDPVLFVAGQAYAACCMCGMCSFRCTCPGVYPCPYCHMGDSDTVQPKAPTDNGTVDIRGVREVLPSAVAYPDVTKRLMAVMRGSRVRGNLALKLFDNVEDGLNFGCSSFDEKNIQ